MSKRQTKSLIHKCLVGAAVSGLLSAGCASDAGPAGPHVTGEIHDADLTVEKFKMMCEDRGGLTEVHASCAGTNSCRGFIYNSWAGDTIVEHTCRGINSCKGISCVELADDTGKSGQDVYEETCLGCHAGPEDSADSSKVYTIFVAPNGDADAALEEFMAFTKPTLVNKVAFGSVGLFDDGTAYSNMPAYHEEYSLAETRKVVDYLLTLELVTEEMQILGINEEVDTSGGGDEH